MTFKESDSYKIIGKPTTFVTSVVISMNQVIRRFAPKGRNLK
jgi:hypothetical protein